MKKSDLRVFPRPNGTWAMQRDGATRVLSTHASKRAALRAGQVRASRDGVDLTIQHRCGWITEGSIHLLEELARALPPDDLILRERSRPA